MPDDGLETTATTQRFSRVAGERAPEVSPPWEAALRFSPVLFWMGLPPQQPLSEEQREELIQKYAATPEGRGRLASATLYPAETMMEHVTINPALVENADKLIAQMERIQGFMTGDEGEAYDKPKFASLLEGLRMLSEEIHGKKVFKKL